MERAQVMAEGLALEDLANECSFIPRGTRIEDRYNENSPHNAKAYVKVAIDFQECDSAMRTQDASEIKKLGNIAFTQQLKRYQDLSETGELEAAGTMEAIEPPQDIRAAPVREPHWNDSVHFYATRQYVVYQKELVVLSPPTAYAPSSPESKKFATVVAPTAAEVQHIQENTPAYRTQTWSHLPQRPRLVRPLELSRPSAPRPNALSVPTQGARPSRQKPAAGRLNPRKGRRRPRHD